MSQNPSGNKAQFITMHRLFNLLMRNKIAYLYTLLTLSLLSLSVTAKAVSFDLTATAPVGSWQLREQIDTNHKGKKTGSKIKTSMVGKEQRDGKLHYWVELEIYSFKISKKGKRKATGKPSIIKSLIAADILSDDPENAVNNMRAFGVETIVQNGNEKPMRISSGNGLMAGVMKMANIEITHDYNKIGTETVNVNAGTFNTEKVNGIGTASMKIVFKKINIDSDSTVWLSNKVPFGIVKLEGTTTTNGKVSSQKGELLEYSRSGAKSAITSEPTDMPTIQNPFAR